MVKCIQKSPAIPQIKCRGSVVLLFFLWSLGLVCGLYFISSAGDSVIYLFSNVSYSRSSILGLLAVIFVPVIISAIAIYLSVPALIYVYSVIKAFCYSCCLCSIAAAFGQSAWLIRFFLLFSAFLSRKRISFPENPIRKTLSIDFPKPIKNPRLRMQAEIG